jgi:predicted transcriptional regulator
MCYSAIVSNTPTTSFRLAPDLLERLDRYAERLSAATGIPVSRAAAASKLLAQALDAEASAAERKRRKARG